VTRRLQNTSSRRCKAGIQRQSWLAYVWGDDHAESVGLAVMIGMLIGCGGGEELAKPLLAHRRRRPRRCSGAAARSRPGQAYELDVIVEGEPDEGAPPLTVKFRATSKGRGGPWKFAWDFGDGATSAEQNPTHIYEGRRVHRDSVTDQRNNTGNDEIDVFVERTRVRITGRPRRAALRPRQPAERRSSWSPSAAQPVWSAARHSSRRRASA
jgi:hypothetical protein